MTFRCIFVGSRRPFWKISSAKTYSKCLAAKETSKTPNFVVSTRRADGRALHWANLQYDILNVTQCILKRVGRYFRWTNRYCTGSGSYHYDDVIMTAMASQITSLTIVYSTVYSDADQRKHQSSASLAFVRGIHRDRWIPAQRARYAENVSIWWRHHVGTTLLHVSVHSIEKPHARRRTDFADCCISLMGCHAGISPCD